MSRRWQLAALAVASAGLGLAASWVFHPRPGRDRRQRLAEAGAAGAEALRDEGRRLAARVRLARAERHREPIEHLEDYAGSVHLPDLEPAPHRGSVATTVLASLALGAACGLLAQHLADRRRDGGDAAGADAPDGYPA